LVKTELGKGNGPEQSQIVLNQNGKCVTDPYNIVDILNNYYTDVVENLVLPKLNSHNRNTVKSQLTNSTDMSVTRPKFRFCTITEEQLIQILSSIKY